ncbi:MAG: NAD(P)/FAD-dependent oxidoreductase [Bacteroidales bacterium]|nr:NAD(P)/FAD-dependent oxidoreductase [Bacteroidales bacterium]
MAEFKKIIIIGAGPAGVVAGYELLKQDKNLNVTILEQSQAIGGISRTVRHNGNRMDIGGHRFFSKNDKVVSWWNNIMPMQGHPAYDDLKLHRDVKLYKGGPDPQTNDRVMLTRNRVSRIFYRKAFFDYPVKLNFNTIKNMGLVTTMGAGFSYLYSVVAKKPEDSLENFYINRFGRKLYSMFFESYTEKLWGRHPDKISPDWGAQRVKGLSIRAVLKDIFQKAFHGKQDESKVETSLIEHFSYPKYGPGQLWETAADEFQKMGGKLQKGCRVTGFDTKEGKVIAVKYESNGKIVTEPIDIVISSMPLKDLIAGLEEVPENIRSIASGLPYRDFITIGLLVKKLALKNETKMPTLSNIIPDCWIYVQDNNVRLGRVQIFNNWSPYMLQNPEETVWIGLEYFCNEGDSFWNMDEKKRIQLAVKELASIGLIEETEPVLDTHCEYVPKAYPAYFDTYNEINLLINYLNSFENLYCIGRNGQHRYNNMDHSMETAFEAVKNIFTNVKDKSNIWNVNQEEEYHEEK